MKMIFKICGPISVLYCIGIIIVTTSAENTNSVTFSWKCKNNKCIKETIGNHKEKEITAFNACMLLCNASTLWPQPMKYSLDGPAVHIKLFLVNHFSNDPIPGILQTMIKGAENVFRDRLKSETSQTKKELSDNPTHKLNIQLAINDLFQHDLTLSTDESYTLTIKEEKNDQMLAVITGETFFGVRHGLETLAQLIVYDNVRNGLIMPKSAHITDKPQFPYRGLLLDTARNYFSVESIKRTIDTMAANKLNSFHWHITGSQSFPLMLYDFPQFAEYGAYSSKKIYTERDVQSIREYALIRGVRLVPELDAPAHTGEGWQWTPENTILCLNKEPWSQYCFQPPCGQLNPLSEHVYKILGELYKNLIRLFKPDIFHMGGDEVHFGCWDTSEEIHKWIAKNHPNNENEHGHTEMKKYDDKAKEKGFFALWSMFQENALVKLKEATASLSHKPDVVLWSSNLAKGDYLNKDINSTDYIVQVWVPQASSNISELLKKGFRIILSNYDALYFDSGFGSYVSDFSTSIYRPWHSVYGNVLHKIDELPEEQRNLILGQEAALWTETASEGSLDSKFWPRGAALAERTWTNPQTYWREAESRMLYHRDRLVRLGVDADAIEPEWCGLNRGGCS